MTYEEFQKLEIIDYRKFIVERIDETFTKLQALRNVLTDGEYHDFSSMTMNEQATMLNVDIGDIKIAMRQAGKEKRKNV